MNTYEIELKRESFIQMTVEAESEDEAVDLAIADAETEHGTAATYFLSEVTEVKK